jgi:ATP-dependent DNA ligase
VSPMPALSVKVSWFAPLPMRPGMDTWRGAVRLGAMALRLPSPMLARSGAIPSGDYGFEVKWDGFRALVSRSGDFQVRSRRGWNMTALVPELGDLPAEASFDGEIVAFADGRPDFPLVCQRLLHGERSVPLTYVIFDCSPWTASRPSLCPITVAGNSWTA